MSHAVTLIPGDGIGPEVVGATRRVLEATGVDIDWDVQEAGAAALGREGHPLPPRVVESIRESGVALKGPTSTQRGGGFRPVAVALRRELDLYAGVRPCRAFEGVPGVSAGTDLVVVRMNHEDLYEGIEYERDGEPAAHLRRFVEETTGTRLSEDTGISLKPLSVQAATRVARAAFAYARAKGRRRVTAVHKATVMRATDGVFLEAARAVSAEHPGIDFDEALVDSLCHSLITRPRDHDVLLLPMLYGDIVSDIGAALVGGLGLAPGVNLGDGCAVFEAVHGSAPRHAGKGRANPMALMLCGAMLLSHLGEQDAAARLERAIAGVIRDGTAVSYDLKRRRDEATAARTAEVADAVAERLAASV